MNIVHGRIIFGGVLSIEISTLRQVQSSKKIELQSKVLTVPYQPTIEQLLGSSWWFLLVPFNPVPESPCHLDHGSTWAAVASQCPPSRCSSGIFPVATKTAFEEKSVSHLSV